MALHRDELTPQLQEYARFDDRGEARYLPYLMYFHQADYRSPVINTDRAGFRISHGPNGETASAAGDVPAGPVRVLTGSSTVLGIGATSDSTTLASQLWRRHAPAAPWLNFGGRCYNSTQELLLFTLHRHLLPEIDEVVVFSGLNDLTVGRLPEWQQGDHGAFWFCGEYFEKMEELREANRKANRRGGFRSQARRRTISTHDEVRRNIPEVVESAADLTLRHLDSWRLLAGPNARVTYVLQPMALWMRDRHAPEEQLLFDEIDRISKLGTWEALYGDISTPAVARAFAERLRAGCEKIGVRFLDLNPVLAEAVTERDWIYVDRAHYTDHGYDVVAGLLADHLDIR
ncbi:SGNH/GDSL hydrolase family protein [Streptomyces alkaliterrae]|uniref:Inducer of phenazine A n=1 Tax=Streptomyces alkaliterrae TaxID=2213162 RepID=A0A5P0YZH1_9ACTN|nr:SGNH/GDSL hydrolase family protein [Streptomyces alkaliterrae]MBB1252650.1 SGNH/GDSL hydrolase family protein [Streptomyces alkaliterrae]MBB1257989.1 SGNH/GDSL hydrolase family protein [Streptomyces alkaliterrae]MQS03959.1 Inducer of phenazine A [Streptomyces alkaliterrae]